MGGTGPPFPDNYASCGKRNWTTHKIEAFAHLDLVNCHFAVRLDIFRLQLSTPALGASCAPCVSEIFAPRTFMYSMS